MNIETIKQNISSSLEALSKGVSNAFRAKGKRADMRATGFITTGVATGDEGESSYNQIFNTFGTPDPNAERTVPPSTARKAKQATPMDQPPAKEQDPGEKLPSDTLQMPPVKKIRRPKLRLG